MRNANCRRLAKAVGGYLIAMTIARFLAHRLWTTVQDRKGNRAVLQYSALVRIVAPAVAWCFRRGEDDVL